MLDQRLTTPWWTLRLAYGLVPIVAGLDKFTNILTDWTQYLSPALARVLPLAPSTFMQLVGIVEIAAGVLVLSKLTRIGAYVVAAWLVADRPEPPDHPALLRRRRPRPGPGPRRLHPRPPHRGPRHRGPPRLLPRPSARVGRGKSSEGAASPYGRRRRPRLNEKPNRLRDLPKAPARSDRAEATDRRLGDGANGRRYAERVLDAVTGSGRLSGIAGTGADPAGRRACPGRRRRPGADQQDVAAGHHRPDRPGVGDLQRRRHHRRQGGRPATWSCSASSTSRCRTRSSAACRAT